MAAVTTINKRYISLLYSCLFTVTSILSFPKVTLAQLRLGTGVQPGLERYFLEYQQRGLPLNKLSGASGCSAGFGASCNKTGAILQKIVREYSDSGYQELLIKAAGGADNYQKFAQFYSNPSAVSLMPYSSFWRKGNEYVLDSYQNTGIGTLDHTESSMLQEIASNFKYAPITLGNERISLRQGIVGLKISYGFTLVEEALKVPDINQRIAKASLDEREASFHQQQFQNATAALKNQSSAQLTNALFYLLSNPYTAVVASLNRPNLGISSKITKVEGITLNGDVENIVGMTTEGTETLLANSFNEEIIVSTTPYAIASMGGIALLVLLGLDSDDPDINSTIVKSVDDILASSNESIVPANEFPPENKINPTKNPPAVLIPESSGTKTFLVLSFLFFLFKRKKVMI